MIPKSLPAVRPTLLRSIAAAGLCLAAAMLIAEPPEETSEPADAPMPLTVREARGQARLLHRTYEATLHTIHRRYYDQEEKEAIPARALEDAFRDVDAGTGRTTRWISVNTPAMNVDHEPKPGFEAKAAEALSAGIEEFELVEDGVYHRAGSVKLFASCLRCHLSGLTQKVDRQRVTGFVVSIPVQAE